jgi:hypothetical protein
LFVRVKEPAHSQRVVTGTVSGPALGERLFLTGNLSYASAAEDGVSDPQGVLPRTPEFTARDLRAGLAATLVLTPKQRLHLLALGATSEALNGAPVTAAREAQPALDPRSVMLGMRWTAQLSSVFTAHLQAGLERHVRKLESMLCRDHPDSCEDIAATVQSFPRMFVSQNRERFERWDETRWQLAGGLDAHLDHGFLQQRVRLAARLETGAFTGARKIPGGQVTTLNGTAPRSMTSDPFTPAGDWASSTGHSRQALLAIEDELAFQRRLFVTPGLGVAAGRLEDPGLLLLSQAAPVVHLGLGWKVSEDGRTWVRASTGRRFDPTADRAAEDLAPAQETRTCDWDDSLQSYSRNCVASGPATRTVGLPCGPSGYADDGSRCVSPPRMPTIWEHTLGMRQALASWASLDLDLVYRRVSDLHRDLETNRLWNASNASVLGYRNGRPQTISDLGSERERWREYRGGTAALAIHASGLRALAAYTYARQQLREDSGLRPGGFVIYDDPDEVHHGVRLAGSYVFPWASFALVYRHDSGQPGNYQPFPPVQNVWGDNRARRGINPGRDINDPGDDIVPPRRPAQSRFDLQVRVRPGHWLPFGMDLYLDVIDATGFFVKNTHPSEAFGLGHWVRLGTQLRY